MPKACLGVLLLVLPALVGLAGCDSSEPSRSEILFSRGAGPLYVVDANSGAVSRVPQTSRFLTSYARWTPDGEHLIFAASEKRPTRFGDGEIYRADLGTGSLHRLTTDRVYQYEPTLSRDGSLALVRGPNGCGYHGGGSDIVVTDTRGYKPRQLTRDCFAHSDLGWSADGKKLIFASSRIGLSEIHSLDLRTGQERRITESRGDQPRLSPDGKWIAFTDSRPRGQYLVLMRADGSGERNLVAVTKNGSGVVSPAWSPDGHTIAYTVFDADGSARIEIVDVDSGDRHALTGDTGQADFSPAWSLDGREIAFIRHNRTDEPNRARLVVASRDGRRLRVLPNTIIGDRFAAVEPTWRP